MIHLDTSSAVRTAEASITGSIDSSVLAGGFYGGDESSIEQMGKVMLNTSIYKEGIIYTVRLEHEGASYQLYIPILETQDAQKMIDRLCRNMGGCIKPNEMEITYEKTDFGVKVTWGGGC